MVIYQTTDIKHERFKQTHTYIYSEVQNLSNEDELFQTVHYVYVTNQM